MRRHFNNFASVIITVIRLCLYKIFLGSELKFGLIERISPNVVLEFNKKSYVSLGKRVRIHSGSKIKVRPEAKLIIENDVKVNYYCIIICQEKIKIGEGTELGPSVYIYDHDHDYNNGLFANSEKEKFKKSSVVIGKNCWIGANSVILRGTTIGDNCIIGAGCVVKENIPSGSIYYQKRISRKIERDINE